MSSTQLSFSCKLLNNQGQMKSIMEGMLDSGRQFRVNEEKCGCQGHEYEYQKISTITSKNGKGVGLKVKLWDVEDVITPSILLIQGFNIVLMPQEGDLNVGDSKNTVILKEIDQLGELLRCSQSQMERRCKVEYLMRKAHGKYEIESAKQKVQQISFRLQQKRSRQSWHDLLFFMKYYQNRRVTLLKKYFTTWLIQYYEGDLTKLNEEAIAQNYFMASSNRNLLKMCFFSWKNRMEGLKCN